MSTVSLYPTLAADAVNFFYKEPAKNQYGSRNAFINKSREEPITPSYQLVLKDEVRMRAPFGISKGLDEKQNSNPDRKSVDLTIESDVLLAQLRALDKHNVQVASDNSEKWFGKKIPVEIINIANMYKPLVNEGTGDNKGKYRPTLRTKINLDKDKGTKFYVLVKDAQGKDCYLPKTSDILTPGCTVAPIVKISSLWFNSTQFGCTFDLTKCIVFQNTQDDGFPFQWGDSPVTLADDTLGAQSQSSVPMNISNNAAHVEGSVTTDDSHGYVPAANPVQ